MRPSRPGSTEFRNAHEWIYIGETEDIRGALLAHLSDRQAALMKRQPAGFVFELCAGANRSSRQGRLVTEYGPHL